MILVVHLDRGIFIPGIIAVFFFFFFPESVFWGEVFLSSQIEEEPQNKKGAHLCRSTRRGVTRRAASDPPLFLLCAALSSRVHCFNFRDVNLQHGMKRYRTLRTKNNT